MRSSYQTLLLASRKRFSALLLRHLAGLEGFVIAVREIVDDVDGGMRLLDLRSPRRADCGRSRARLDATSTMQMAPTTLMMASLAPSERKEKAP